MAPASCELFVSVSAWRVLGNLDGSGFVRELSSRWSSMRDVKAERSDGRLPEGSIRGRKHQRLYAEGRYRAYIIASPRETCISERYNRSIRKSMMESSDLCHHVAVILESNWDKLRFHLADAR